MRAAPAMKKRLDSINKIKIMYNTAISEVKGDGKLVTSVDLENTKDKSKTNMPIDGVFLAIGNTPNTEIFKKFLETDDAGYIYLPTHSQETSIPGVFAAGDVADKHYRQAGVAAGDGIKAALDAVGFLQENGFNDEFAQKLEKNYFDPYEQVTPIKLAKISTNKEFDKLAKSAEPLIVKVGASYCPPCKTLGTFMESVAAQFADKAHFVQIELDDEPKELIKRFDLKEIPSTLIFKNEKLVSRHDKKVFTKRELASNFG